MDLAEAIDRYVLGSLLPAKDLPAIAVEALNAGLDSASLRRVAEAKGEDADEIRRLFIEAVHELNLPVPSVEQAAMSLARRIVEDVLSGKIGPSEGAHRVWDVHRWAAWEEPDNPQLHQLLPFVAHADEYDDDRNSELRELIAGDIVDECRKFLSRNRKQ